jgi:hypothetical protein
MTNKVKNLAAQILGRKGGMATFEKHGKKHFRKIAKEKAKMKRQLQKEKDEIIKKCF